MCAKWERENNEENSKAKRRGNVTNREGEGERQQ